MPAEFAILKTIAYFDLFDFPLTAEEVFEYLWQAHEASLEMVKSELENLVKNGKLETSESYYFLPGRRDLVIKRNRSAAEGEKKLRRARFAVKLISGIPFLKAIFVCNSVAAETSNENSDIDFFIIGRTGRLWFVRFFSNLILKIFGLRTGAKHSANRVCLSFFVDDKHLDLSGLRAVNDDVYLVYWLRQLYPLYDPENYFEKIQRENVWTRTYIASQKTLPVATFKPDRFKTMCEALLANAFGDWYERLFKKIQYPKLRVELKKMAESGDKKVVISDIVLKFHETDARLEIRSKWLANCNKYDL
jgi:hypothetical protein